MMKKSDRKYHLAMLFAVVGSAGLLFGKLDGGSYVALATLLMATYGAVNVASKKFSPGQEE